MSTVTTAIPGPATAPARTAGSSRTSGLLKPFATLARRRLALSASTPRELVVPLLTPVLFAVVIAPALAKLAHDVGGIDYMSFVAVATVGLLIPLNCMFSGIGVIVDRESGARRDLLAAPVPRSLIVFGNLAVALLLSCLQVLALLGFAVLRGADLHVSTSGIVWFVGAATALAVVMYGAAEALANKVGSQEEYVGALPAVAIVPWFLAGTLFPITALPGWLAAVSKVLPLTHALAVMRYGLLDAHGAALHQIWGMSNVAAMAALSLGVVAAYAVLLLSLAVRVFTRAAVK